MDIDQAVRDEATLRRYAETRREAMAASSMVTGDVSRQTWARVSNAMVRANDGLAQCDPAWLDLRAAYLNMVATHGSPGIRRRALRSWWGPSICTACRYAGPDSAVTERMKRARNQAASMPSDRWRQRIEAMHERAENERAADGPLSAKAINAIWALVNQFQRKHFADLASSELRMLVKRLPDGHRRIADLKNAAWVLRVPITRASWDDVGSWG